MHVYAQRHKQDLVISKCVIRTHIISSQSFHHSCSPLSSHTYLYDTNPTRTCAQLQPAVPTHAPSQPAHSTAHVPGAPLPDRAAGSLSKMPRAPHPLHRPSTTCRVLVADVRLSYRHQVAMLGEGCSRLGGQNVLVRVGARHAWDWPDIPRAGTLRAKVSLCGGGRERGCLVDFVCRRCCTRGKDAAHCDLCS